MLLIETSLTTWILGLAKGNSKFCIGVWGVDNLVMPFCSLFVMRYASAYLITLQNQIEMPVHEDENYYYLTIQYFGNLKNPLNTNSTD